MKQNDLKPHKKETRKRIGRGNGSGQGTYCCRGVKGQKARKSGSKGNAFEGGQTPLIRKMPKLKGFKNVNRKDYTVINFATLEKCFSEGETVDKNSLVEKNLVSKKTEYVKILGMGELTKKLDIKLPISSAAAKKMGMPITKTAKETQKS